MELHSPSQLGEKFQRLVAIMARLRAPDGCPWDREQSFDSIKPYLLEEAYEVMDAIDRRSWDDLADELGDLMLQAVFFAQMASEERHFDIGHSLDAIHQKLVRRHPHIFPNVNRGTVSAESADDVKRNWDEIKKEERRKRGQEPKALLDTIPRAVPALVEAQQISSKAASVGFDWPEISQVLDKLHEELAELEQARTEGLREGIQAEVGDLLFTIVNLARFLKVDPEQALRATNAKFRRRFGHVEQSLAARGREFKDSNIDEMESLWREAKTAT